METRIFPVFLRCQDRPRNSWAGILKIFRDSNLNCSGLSATNEGFRALFQKLIDVDKLFTDSLLTKLDELNCVPVKPAFLKANRTIIVKFANNFIMDHDECTLLEDINENNSPWLKIGELFKFPSGKTFKFECASTDMASSCLERGFYVLNLAVNPRSLVLEDSHQITYCYKCYAINDHHSKSCNKPKEFKACSLCGSNQHTFKDCQTTTRKCLNCHGEHSTLSKTCPSFKEAVAVKSCKPTVASIVNPSAQGTSYARQSHKQAPINPETSCGLGKNEMFRGFMSLLYASALESDLPGSFTNNLAKLLQANELPSFCTADLPAPVSIQVPVNDYFSKSNLPRPTSTLDHMCGNEGENSGNSSKNEQTSLSENQVSDLHGTITHDSSLPSSTVLQPSRNSQVFKNKPPLSLRNPRPCILCTRKGFPLGRGKALKDVINNRNAVIEHNCSDEPKCVGFFANKVLAGDLMSLKKTKLTPKKFDEKYSILVNPDED